METSCSAAQINKKSKVILDSAVECFLHNGYGSTSMDMIAARANVSKATIYNKYKSKSALFAAVIHRGVEHDFMLPNDLMDHAYDARTILTKLAHGLLTFMLQDKFLAFHRIVVAESIRQPDLAIAFWQAGPSILSSRLALLMSQLHQRKLLNIPDPHIASIIFSNMLKSEYFFCRLYGLPLGTEVIDLGQTVENAVNAIISNYTV